MSNLIKIILVGPEYLPVHGLIAGAGCTKVTILSPKHGKETV
jgi:hypothetical protein